MKAVILAAGLSKRFGGKKLLMKIEGKPMVCHVADLVSTMGFKQMILVYSDEEIRKAVRESIPAAGFTFLYNKDAELGLSTSIKLALEPDTPEGVIFFMGDQPFLDKATVIKLLEAFYLKKGSIIVPVYGENRGNPVIFSGKWTGRLKTLTGDVGGRVIMREYPEEVYEVRLDHIRPGRDIDTQEEFNAFLKERN